MSIENVSSFHDAGVCPYEMAVRWQNDKISVWCKWMPLILQIPVANNK